jgi:hypothetical protein
MLLEKKYFRKCAQSHDNKKLQKELVNLVM